MSGELGMMYMGFFYALGAVLAFIIGVVIMNVISLIFRKISERGEPAEVINLGEVTEDELFSEDFNRRLRENILSFEDKDDDEEEK